MFAREDGMPFDLSALDEQVERAVEFVVARQLKVGLDIINEARCRSPVTPLTSRTGLRASAAAEQLRVPGPEAYQVKTRMFDDPGRKHRKAPACNAPIRMRDLDAPKQDAQRLQRSLGDARHRYVSECASRA